MRTFIGFWLVAIALVGFQLCTVNECHSRKCPTGMTPYYTGAVCTPSNGCVCVATPE